jgi:repressor LexA
MNLMLTGKQIRVLRFYRDYRRDHGIAPTLDEAALALGVSKVTVHEHLYQLERKGAVQRDKAKSRAVAILYDPDAAEAVGAIGPVSVGPMVGSAAGTAVPSLPLVGMIAAGRPIEAIEDRQELSLTELVPTGDDIYLLRVRGKSMIDDHIEDGDLVVVEKRNTARNGEIVVAILEGEEATLKRFYREADGRIRLQPANPEMQPIFVTSVQIRGVVKGVIRRFR